MKVLIITFLLSFSFFSFSQSAEELNSQSKEFLDKGDVKSALPLIKKAAELGQPEAQFNYALFFQQGIEVEKNDSIANLWLLKSAEQGSVNAQFKIAYSYAVGRGTSKDMKKAFYWSVQCANQNDPECIGNVASCYQQGMGVEKSIDSALAWTVRAAILPDLENLKMSGMITNARITMAKYYLKGINVKQSDSIAYMWLLIYNESKRDHSILVQLENIEEIKELENKLTPEEQKQEIINAEKLIGRKLKNLDNLYLKEL